VCRFLGIAESVLEDWEKRGFVERAPEYSMQEMVALRTLLALRRSRYGAQHIQKALDSLREKLNGIANPLTELKVFRNGSKLAVQLGDSKMEAVSGQLLLDFDREEINRLLQFPSKNLEARQRQEAESRNRQAEVWFEKGVDLEQTGATPDQIIQAYQRALECNPEHTGALVNLGTVCYHLRRFSNAAAHYKRALEIRPDYALAHFNLGNLYDETGDWARALEHYLHAIRIQPDYADAHYNVALLYQTHGEPLKAVSHWRRYLKLDPQGYWAGIARRELSKLRAAALVK